MFTMLKINRKRQDQEFTLAREKLNSKIEGDEIDTAGWMLSPSSQKHLKDFHLPRLTIDANEAP